MADCVALISQSASYQLSFRERNSASRLDSILEIGKGYVIASLSNQLERYFDERRSPKNCRDAASDRGNSSLQGKAFCFCLRPHFASLHRLPQNSFISRRA